jgi:hypothetical protein
MFIEHEKISCGCCRSHDENERCVCHIHQDVWRGQPAKTCSFHMAYQNAITDANQLATRKLIDGLKRSQ